MGLYKYQKRDVKYMFMYGYFFFGTFGTVCYEINLQIVKDLLRGNSSNKWDADTKDAYQNLLHFM